MVKGEQMTFEKELEQLINKHSVDNDCETPDFILAQACLGFMREFSKATEARDKWFGREKHTIPPLIPPLKENS